MKAKKYKITFAAKILILQILLSCIAVFGGFTWRVYAEAKKWDNVIYPGIKIANLDLSGKTKAESIAIIKANYINELLKKKINIQVLDKSYAIEGSKLITNYDIDSAITSAFNYGKDLGLFEKGRLLRRGAAEQYKVSFNYNEAYIKEFVDNISREVNREPKDSSVEKLSDGSISISPDVKGCKVETTKLMENLKEVLNEGSVNDVTIKAPVQEMQAAITKDKITSIDSNIASFRTDYSSSSYERSSNIELAAKFINGRILLPGDIFSFNEVVGERTNERGFKEAPVIIGNKVESGFGGGICQVSSTLYNAVLRTGLSAVERIHHTLPSSYVSLGMDATVDWGDIDFKFKNTFNYPVFIEAKTEDKQLLVDIYSNSSLTKRKYVVSNTIYKTIQTSLKTIDDPNLPVGQIEQVQKGYDGHKVKVIRTAYENGAIVGSEVISDDYYNPVTNIIKVGVRQ